jgi:hypothetical protein
MEKITAELLISDEKINVENLKITLEALIVDAEGSNKGNKAAARRFRIRTNNLASAFKEVRKITPQTKS